MAPAAGPVPSPVPAQQKPVTECQPPTVSAVDVDEAPWPTTSKRKSATATKKGKSAAVRAAGPASKELAAAEAELAALKRQQVEVQRQAM